MPIYEYACLACGAHFEKLVYGQSAVACPACESARVSRQLSVVGVRTGSRVCRGQRRRTGFGRGLLRWRMRLPLTIGRRAQRTERGPRGPSSRAPLFTALRPPYTRPPWI